MSDCVYADTLYYAVQCPYTAISRTDCPAAVYGWVGMGGIVATAFLLSCSKILRCDVCV